MRNNLRIRSSYIGYTFIAPQYLGYIVFTLLPLVGVIYFSMTDYSLMMGTRNWIGFENYRTLFINDPLFSQVVGNTLFLMAGYIPVAVAMAVVLGVLSAQSFRGNSIVRGVLFAPVVTSAVAWAIVWKFLLQEQGGPVNLFLSQVGLGSVKWLGEPVTAMISVIYTRAIKNVGINMIIIMGATLNVPEQLYEAAMIDGASKVNQFFRLTLPMISPSVLLVTVTTSVGILKVFDTIMLLTGGGPYNSTMVLVYYLYYQAFQFFEIGYASTIALLIFLVALCLTLLQWAVRKKVVHYE